MSLDYETVALPVVKGIDVNTRARLVPAQSLLEAVNTRFTRGVGAEKRRGHTARRVRGTKPLPANVDLPLYTTPPPSFTPYQRTDRGIPSTWLFGWGPITSNNRADDATALETSPHPDAGLIFGSTSRDNETLLWNGHQLFSRTPSLPIGSPYTAIGPAVLPTLRSQPIAKTNSAQGQPDAADNGTLRIVAWLSGSTVYYTILDSVSGAVISAANALTFTTPLQVRVMAVGGWFHIVVVESSGGTLQCRSLHQDSASSVVSRSFGACPRHFDMWKVSETSWVIARNRGDQTIGVTWLNPEGTTRGIETPNITPTLDAAYTTLYSVAICVHPLSGGFGLVWNGIRGGFNYTIGCSYPATSGTPIGAAVEIHSGASALAERPVAIAPKYLYSSGGLAIYNAHCEDSVEGSVYIGRFSTSLHYTTKIFNCYIASQAFRVGDRTFLWLGRTSTLQSTWVMVDESLRPVGHQNYATANTSVLPFVTSVNWSGTAPAKDIFVHHCALGFKVRVSTDTPTTVGINKGVVYSEPSISFTELEFLPPLRATQAGRCTYFAGAQVWSYDGNQLVESGFHFAPELPAPVASGSGNALTAGSYTFRVDLCHRNAQGEEVRSHSFYTAAVSVTAGQKLTLSIPTTLTRKETSYLLVFSNAANGVLWYLANSRDPSSALFLANNQAAASISFVHDGIATPTDAGLISREFHPGNAFGYIEPIAAPACEVIASGRDRVWLAGGEISAGQVIPSRLFEPYETPSFNPALAIQVDRSAEPITAIGFVGDISVYFRSTQTYVHDDAGPSNILGSGVWSSPRLALSDVGAVGPEGLALISLGLIFQSPAGFRLIGGGGGVQPIGAPVDVLARSMAVSGAVVVGTDQEVRWYSRNGTALVYNYQYDCWSTWTVAAAGVTRNTATGLALVAAPDGSLWEETEGVWRDDSKTYRMRIRFAWLRAGSLMDWQRVRRIGALGEWDGVTAHSVHVDIYYDERDFAEEWFDWSMPADATDASWNTDTFGTGSFGDGVLGDD